MCATEVLQKCLRDAFGSMHALRRRVLLRAIEAMGWQWLDRLRNTTYLKPVDAPDEPDEWVTCKAMYGLARRDAWLVQLGREALVRRWSSTHLSKPIDQLRHPSPQLLDQLGASA